MACTVLSQTQKPSDTAPTVLKAESTFVWVPALLQDRKGAVVNNIDAPHLSLFDNGIAEKTVKIDTEGLPISLVILMQTGGAGGEFLHTYDALPDLIGNLVGNSAHEITFATFDSRIEQIWHFPSRTDGLDYALRHQTRGDQGAAINDAIAFGIQQLRGEPGEFRRIVLLLSQEQDEGSSTSPLSLLKQLGTSSTVIYSLTFPAQKLHPARSTKKGRGGSEGDAQSRVIEALRSRTAEQVSLISGGGHFRFIDQPDFNSSMIEAASEFHHITTLGFQPACCSEGIHRITLTQGAPKLHLTARQFYWQLP